MHRKNKVSDSNNMNKNNHLPIFLPGSRLLSGRVALGFALALVLPWQGGCAPTVTIETPKEPITINMNIKIDHEVRVKLEKEIDDLINEESDIF
ncbi:MAG: YnbE-like lipoprotein [Candidatus Kentron sp. G]|nr:MAG: YnbE-like lipoprotein [Candidatus Kentron sp. G]VFN04089.1 MAG: YnbE-like lipoprotein [Candidatus Kentron sp. G]VFN05545.1 MAG: YnbE-like lipoprotein [Candidatus Kentron sp. G]